MCYIRMQQLQPKLVSLVGRRVRARFTDSALMQQLQPKPVYTDATAAI
jgi:hypothetical protein